MHLVSFGRRRQLPIFERLQSPKKLENQRKDERRSKQKKKGGRRGEEETNGEEGEVKSKHQPDRSQSGWLRSEAEGKAGAGWPLKTHSCLQAACQRSWEEPSMRQSQGEAATG